MKVAQCRLLSQSCLFCHAVSCAIGFELTDVTDVVRKRKKVMKEKRKLRDKMKLKMVIPGDQIEVGNDNEMFSLQSLRSCKVNWWFL